MKGTELAYIAGIVDGEGYIRVKKVKDTRLQAGITYVLYVHISNRDEGLLRWLQSNFGGAIDVVPREKDNHGTCWCWSIKRRKALAFLVVVLPYLKLKRAQAEIAIAFQKAKRPSASYPYAPKTDKELMLEQERRCFISTLSPRAGNRRMKE